MESAANHQPVTHSFKNKVKQIMNQFILEISIITALLFCFNFWNDLPDFDMHPYLGKGIAGLGIAILFGMITFKLKWPMLIALAAMIVYLGINLANNESSKEIVNTKKETQVSYIHLPNQSNTDNSSK